MLSKKNKIIYLLALFFISTAFVWAQIWLATHENQTIDEGVHVSAGYSYLVLNDFRLNPEHPPLAKEIAAIPLLFIRPNFPSDSSAWEQADQWSFARIFLYKSGNNPDQILLFTRLPMIFMSLLLGLLIARWAYKLGHWQASIVALFAYATSPVVLAHGHLVTTDIPVALGVTAAAYFFTETIQSPKFAPLFATALSVAFAVNVKFTGLILFALLPLLYLFFVVFKKKSFSHLGYNHGVKLFGFSLLFSFLVAFIITGGATGSALDDPYLGAKHLVRAYELPLNYPNTPDLFVQGYTWTLEHVPFPAYPYATGLIEFITHLGGGHESYFLGNYSDFGNILYFPVAFLVKTRLAILILLSLIFTLFVKQSVYSWKYVIEKKSFLIKVQQWCKTFSVHGFTLGAMALLFFISTLSSKVNIGVRHILIVYPFVFIGISQLWALQLRNQKMFRILISSILLIGTISVFLVWPFPMAFFSESVGGPSKGHTYMLDSNLDWGQNLKYLNAYLDKNKISEICLGYFGQGDMASEGIHAKGLPDNESVAQFGTPNCVVVSSLQVIYGRDERFSWLKSYNPDEIIGYGLYVFDFRR